MIEPKRTSARRNRRPTVEGLETRQLLSGTRTILARTGQPINDKDLSRLELQLQNNTPWKERRISYESGGKEVVVTLYGAGSLLVGKEGGTQVDAAGNLHLVFDNTTNASRIIGTVKGHLGRNRVIPLASVRDVDSLPGSTSGEGVDPIGALQLPDFGLVRGGEVNLMGGVLEVNLRSAAADTAFYLKEGVPVEVAGPTSQTIVTGGASVGGITQITAIDTPTTTDASGTTGLQVRIDRIEASPRGVEVDGKRQVLGDPQIYTVDTTPGAAQLLRFNAQTGDLVAARPMPGLTSTSGVPVGLSLDSEQSLVLVGDVNTVYAFDLEMRPVGSFSTAGLAGFTTMTGIGSSATSTVFTSLNGPGYALDVDQSLATGSAVVATTPSGVPFAPIVPQREFLFNGDATGLAGSSTILADGAGHFDTAQPNLFQFGTIGVAPVGPFYTEAGRAAVPSFLTRFQNAGADGLLPNPTVGLGSIDNNLARLTTSVTTGISSIALYSAANVATGTVIPLKGTTAVLSGLSEAAHPELAGASIIDVEGNLKRYVGKQVNGLVLNTRGAVNLISIHTARDSAFVGRPLNHVEFVRRQRVQLISTSRGTNGQVIRGGITIDKNLLRDGPLMLPRKALI